MSDKIKMLEKENASMRECISSVLMRLADYDGYKGHAPGLEQLIDGAMETLSSGYPERIADYEGRECCPLCFQRFKKEVDPDGFYKCEFCGCDYIPTEAEHKGFCCEDCAESYWN